jgi:uncharacterized membrane protein
MSGWSKYVWAALAIAAISHFAIISAVPSLLTGVAISRLGAAGFNQWRIAPRVTPESRTIVRPAPDFAYSACAYDLGAGPVRLAVTPSPDYWSLSLYADNSDNYFVTDDRESREGADIVLVRSGRQAPDGAARVVFSPSRRGVALIRRLAPTPAAYNTAAAIAGGDVCALFVPAS